MAVYSPSQLMNKGIWVTKKIPLYTRKPDLGGVILKYTKPGEFIGTFYSYVHNASDNTYYWMIQVAANQFVFFKFEDNVVDRRKLRQQGALSDEELREKEEWERADLAGKIKILFDKLGKAGNTLLIIGGVAYVGVKLIDKKTTNGNRY